MKTFLFILSLVLLLARPTHAQSMRPLKDGDPMPDIWLPASLNGDAPIRFSDLNKNKPVLFDFWATSCTFCLSNMIKLDSLQAAMKDTVEIVAVTKQPRSTIDSVFSRRPALSHLKLRIITDDSVLSKLFPYRLIPHIVWIEAGGKLLGQTFHEQVTPANIRAMYLGEAVALERKKDQIDVDVRQPFDFTDSGFLFRTTLARGRTDMRSRLTQIAPKPGFIQRLFHPRIAPISLFLLAAFKGKEGLDKFSKLELHIKDSSRYFNSFDLEGGYSRYGFHSQLSYDQANLRSYEMILDKAVPDSVFYSYMLEDLNRYFPAKAKLELLEKPVWVIYNASEESKDLQSRYSQPKVITAPGGMMQRIEAITMDELVAIFNQSSKGIPFVNQTQNRGPLDMILTIDLTQSDLPIDLIKKQFSMYGFGIKQGVAPVNILVLREP